MAHGHALHTLEHHMAHTMHTTTRTAGDRQDRIMATRHRDHTPRRATTRAAALAAVLAEYR